MFADIRRHKTDYSILAVLTGVYLVVVLESRSVPLRLLWATGVYALIYFTWGVVHHAHTGSLHPKVVLEYFLVSALAMVIVSTLLV